MFSISRIPVSHATLPGRRSCTVPAAAVLFTVLAMLTSTAQERPVVAFFGDSITEGWMDAALHPEWAYPSVTDSILNARGAPIDMHNLGRAGETTDDALRRAYPEVLSIRPDLVLIAFGSNDFYIPGYATSPRVPIARFRDNLDILVDLVRDQGIRVVLLGLPPLIESRYARFVDAPRYAPFGGGYALNRLYAQAIEDVASRKNVTWIPVPFDTSAQSAACLGFDGQHPTPEGHRRIASVVASALENALVIPAPPASTDRSVQIYPQPASAASNYIRFVVPAQTNDRCTVRLYDAAGRLIRILDAGTPVAGRLHVPWDLSSEEHRLVAPGMYVAHITSMHLNRTQTLIVY
jgi:lysophospholipase L1-like esterase